MAQGPGRLKSSREKRLPDDKTHDEKQGGASGSIKREDGASASGKHKCCHRGTSASAKESSVTRQSSTQRKSIPRYANGNGGFDMGIKNMSVLEDSSVMQTVEIIKRPGQTLGFYIREGNGAERQDGVFISRIQIGTVAESNGLLHVGDEILTVNSVQVSKMSLDDVVILMSIPKKLILTIRTKRRCSKNASCPSLAQTEKEEHPVVVLKKGRSSSASALEMTEKSPEASEHYTCPHTSDYSLIGKDGSHVDKATSSRYASIFISPQKAEAKLLSDESNDSGHSSDGLSSRTIDPTQGSHYGATSRYSDSSSGSYLVPSTSSGSGLQYEMTGGRDYLKGYTLMEGGYKKLSPRMPQKSDHSPPRLPPPRTAHAESEPRAAYGADMGIYANISNLRDYMSYRGYHDDRHSQERLRDLLQSKKYGRLTRSRSPECYNSDSEVIYTHPRNVDPRGFASDYESYSNAISDDEGGIYAIPLLPTSSSSELQQLLKKFTSLSHELQQEQSKLQKQLATSRGRPGLAHSSRKPTAVPPSAEEHWVMKATAGSPSPSRKAAGTQTIIHSRIRRKPSPDSLQTYRTYHMQDPSSQDTKHMPASSAMPTTSGMPKASRQDTTAATSVNMVKTFDTDGKSISRSTSRFRDLQLSKKPLQIHYGEYATYKGDIRKRLEMERIAGLNGILDVHILSGQGLKSFKMILKDFYCVVAIDSINKARTMIRTGAVNFDWDEKFDVELEDAKELTFLVYNWDPNFRHRLCFHGSIFLPGFLLSEQKKHIALRTEPKGILYVDLVYKEPSVFLKRLPSVRKNALFGTDLEEIIKRENTTYNVPLIVQKCIKEIESRGLETVGIYRLCGSARRKVELRELFERSAATVDTGPDSVADIHVATGVLKDYLRELPEPLFTNALYQMLLDALSVRLPDDPDGSAKLMLSILECLPKANQDTMAMVLHHLKKVTSKSDHNKMTTENIAVCFGPVLLCPSSSKTSPAEFAMNFKKHIEILKYLLEIWPNDGAVFNSDPPQGLSEASLSPKSGADKDEEVERQDATTERSQLPKDYK